MATNLSIRYVKHDDGSTTPLTLEGVIAAIQKVSANIAALQRLNASAAATQKLNASAAAIQKLNANLAAIQKVSASAAAIQKVSANLAATQQLSANLAAIPKVSTSLDATQQLNASAAAIQKLSASAAAIQKLNASLVGVRRRVRILSTRARPSTRWPRARQSRHARRRTRIAAVAEPSSLRVDLSALSEVGCVDPDQPLDAFVRVCNAPVTNFPSFQNQGVA